MFVTLCVEPITIRWISTPSTLLQSRRFVSNPRVFSISTCARFASRSSKPQSAKPRPPTDAGKKSLSIARKRQIETSGKASLLLKRLSKTQKIPIRDASKSLIVPKVIPPRSKSKSHKREHEDLGGSTRFVDKKEAAILNQIILNQRKLLWPGIWYIAAIAGTYGAFTYFDARSGEANSAVVGSQLPDRTQLLQSWFLTPTVIREGLIAGWNEMDNLTMGIVVVCVAMQFLKRSPLPIWEKFIHITGERKWTAFTYPLIHSSWLHVATNMFGVCWFLPSVVHYFDDDVFHTAAFMVSVPLITSYLQHFAFRLLPGRAISMNIGASGMAAAAFGAFCMLYPDEKVWMPSFVILRLDAKYWGMIWAIYEMTKLKRVLSKRRNPHIYIAHLLSFGIGAAYIYFDGKDKVWKPLLATFYEDTTAQ